MIRFAPSPWRVEGGDLPPPGIAVYGLRAMLEDARESKRRPEIRAIAFQAIRGCRGVDARCYLQALWTWAVANLRYVPDPAGEEYLQHPTFTLAYLAGDCDDLAPAFAALAGSVGLQAWLVVGSADPLARLPGHVLAAVEIDGRLVPCDLSVESPQLGRYPPGFRTMRRERV